MELLTGRSEVPSDMERPCQGAALIVGGLWRGVGHSCRVQRRRQGERQVRRLINLIFAGRNRTVMIRRELPRTSGAGWVRRPDRIERRRILLSVSPRPATGAASCMSLAKPPLWNGGRAATAARPQNASDLLSGHLVRLDAGRQIVSADIKYPRYCRFCPQESRWAMAARFSQAGFRISCRVPTASPPRWRSAKPAIVRVFYPGTDTGRPLARCIPRWRRRSPARCRQRRRRSSEICSG